MRMHGVLEYPFKEGIERREIYQIDEATKKNVREQSFLTFSSPWAKLRNGNKLTVTPFFLEGSDPLS